MKVEKAKKQDMRKQVDICLDFPVQLADRKLEKITMRRPTVGDLLKHNLEVDISFKDSVVLLADLCGLVPEELELLDFYDFEKLQAQLLSFRGLS